MPVGNSGKMMLGTQEVDTVETTIIVPASLRTPSNAEDVAATSSFTTKYQKFAGYKPKIFELGLSSSNILFRVGIYAVQPNPPPFVSKTTNDFVSWYESKFGKVADDSRTVGDKLMDFAIQGLIKADTEGYGEFLKMFETACDKFFGRAEVAL